MNLPAHSLLNGILETISLQIAVIDQDGRILYVNLAWRQFGLYYGLPLDADWAGISYLDVCQANEDTNQPVILQGIQQVLSGKVKQFKTEYLCHTPIHEPTWLTLDIVPMMNNQGSMPCFLVSLTNITLHKQAELEISALSMSDPLTSLSNRRRLELFLRDEWSRAIRHQSGLSVMMIDADHFKLLNDSMGHAAGDECLKKIASILKKYTNRPGDLAARYGGEEFVLVLGQTNLQQAINIGELIRQNIMDLNILFADQRLMTVSIGLSSLGENTSQTSKRQQPQSQWLNFSEDGHFLIEQADKALYVAKRQGRNRLEVYDKNHGLTIQPTVLN